MKLWVKFRFFKRISRISNWRFLLKLSAVSILIFIFIWSIANSGYFGYNFSNCQWPPTDKVAVIAVTGPPYLSSWSTVKYSKLFHLYLPFCVAAWKRIGYSTLIVVIGEPISWHHKGHYLNYVYKTLEKYFNCWVGLHFVQVQPTSWISYVKVAQVIRLFAADLGPLKNKPNIYLVTNDADTLPLHDIYSLPNNSYDIRLSTPFRRYFRVLGSDENLSLFCFLLTFLILFFSLPLIVHRAIPSFYNWNESFIVAKTDGLRIN